MIGCFALLLIIAGVMMVAGFWPVALVLVGLAMLSLWGDR
jgi:hypothetical protein